MESVDDQGLFYLQRCGAVPLRLYGAHHLVVTDRIIVNSPNQLIRYRQFIRTLSLAHSYAVPRPFACNRRMAVVARHCLSLGKGGGYGRNEGDSKAGESLVGERDMRRLGDRGSSL